MVKKVILIHGFNKNKRDMNTLKIKLEKLGYEAILLDFPLTFKELEHSIPIIENEMENILSNLPVGEKISLIGHSTGGLLIRHYLIKTKQRDKIDSCIFIATPNRGSKLANMALRYIKPFTDVFKTLKSLHSEKVAQIAFNKYDEIKMGAIAGNNRNLFLGKLLNEENDGRVCVSSVELDEVDDFIILPYGHKEIHHKFETAKLIDYFIKSGKFKEDKYREI